MTFLDFNKRFPTEKAAIDHFVEVRYKGMLTCPHCGAIVKVYRYRERAKVCHCKNCNDSFSPFTNTIFENSSTDMRKWFYAIHLFLNAKKGVSASNIQREVGVTYKTAWRMLQQIRIAMGNEKDAKAFEAIVEVDETYVGGRPRRDNVRLDTEGNPILGVKEPSKRGRGTSKTPVVGVKERESGNVYAKVMLPDEAGKKLTGKQLLEVIEAACKEGATVISDDFKGYWILDDKRCKKYVHLTVNHSLGEFSAGNGVHTNNIENFWSIVKRGHHGVYHSWSVKYLQRYIDEFCFRANHRKDVGAFDTLLRQSVTLK
jgi:transposase-like protein